MIQRINKAATLLLMLVWLAGQCAADGKYFGNKLTLPDFPGFDVFVQNVDDAKATKLKEKRWSLSDKPNTNTKKYLLVSPNRNIWVTITELHTPYGGNTPLSPKKFEAEYVSRLSQSATVGNKTTLKSRYAGNVGYYYLTDKSKKYGTRLLYIPGAKHGKYGDKRAYAVGVTHTAASTDQAKALLQKILDNVKVSK